MGRTQRVVLCWVLSISFLLMPYSTLHVHLSDHDHSELHGGHVHDFALDHDARSVDQVMQVSVAAAPTSPTGWTDWLPIICVVVLLSLARPFVTSILRPPSRDSEPIARRPHRLPPLRGPPLISITSS